jgi:hypothetical protein
MREIRKINGKKIWVEIPDKEPLIEVKKKRNCGGCKGKR